MYIHIHIHMHIYMTLRENWYSYCNIRTDKLKARSISEVKRNISKWQMYQFIKKIHLFQNFMYLISYLQNI